MKKSKIYLLISVITYLLLMIIKKIVNVPDIIYIMVMVFTIAVAITAIKEQNKEGK